MFNFKIFHTVPSVFLFFSILWCCRTSNHPQKDLAMFGYRHAIKLEITEILLYPATCLNNVQKYGDFKDLLLNFFCQMAKIATEEK
jgi:hypothetical protein